MAEFRALRAAVLRRWSRTHGAGTAETLDGLVRFNEGIDQAIAESLARFVKELALKDEQELRRSEAEARRLAEQQAHARRAEQRLNAALVQARMAFREWRPHSDALEASQTLGDLLGLLPGDGPLTGARRLGVVHADDRAALERRIHESIRAETGWHTEFRVSSPDPPRRQTEAGGRQRLGPGLGPPAFG